MNAIIAILILTALFTLRFVVPLLISIVVGRASNRLAK
jgi:hypothetical protein